MFAWVLCTRKEKKEGRRDATWRVAYTTEEIKVVTIGTNR